MRNIVKRPGVLIAALGLSLAAPAQVTITVDRNTVEASPAFKFRRVPSPVKDHAAAGARLKLVVGQADGNSAGLKALTDGVLPASEDEPDANFFFADGSDGGRFLLDLGQRLEIARVNTYSWHPDTRGPQVYNLLPATAQIQSSTRNLTPRRIRPPAGGT